jgi:nucleotide-binding universal stress UspA family protein
VDSDEEADFGDIKRAQKLSVNMTKIMSTPATNRSVQTIYRGDFAKMQQEAQDHQRRVRKYLVATDLSDEAAHALEWTIGTVLRDGDTLLAIYCVDEEVGISNDTSGDDMQIKEQAAAVAASTKPSNCTPILHPAPAPSPLGYGFGLDTPSTSSSPAGRGMGKAEQERYRAVQDISARVSKLLRKTKLQVKVVIEVIHCKSPKHLITEVIDYLSPTLVILGSRGRSALKGFVHPCSITSTTSHFTKIKQCHSRLFLQLPSDQILGSRHGCTQTSPQTQQIQASLDQTRQQPKTSNQEPRKREDRLID